VKIYGEMTFEILPAHAIPIAEQAKIFNRAFKGYLAGWAEMDEAALTRFISVQGADPCYSRFVAVGGKPAGFGYINRTGNVSRLSAMGTVPEARRTGAATWLLTQLLKEAKERNDEAMVLEVFEQNTAAVALYKQSGFETITRLFGWRRMPRAAAGEDRPGPMQEISPTLASQLPRATEYPAIPWQISRHAIAKLPIARAFRVEHVCAVIGDTNAESIRIHACFAAETDWSALRRVVSAVLRQFPEQEFFAPAIFPEQFGKEIFEPLGFLPEPLNQLLMRRDL
jgi:ribosomal protein S18 acetylase RimI-like enzyme